MTIYTPQQAHDDITELFDAYYDAKKADVQADSIPPNKRIESADAIVEQYVEINGKRPPAGVLSRLATYILLDVLSDPHPDKMARGEYPIMSYGQTGRHFERNRLAPDLEYDKEYVRGAIVDPIYGGKVDILDKESMEIKASEWRAFLSGVLTERQYFIVEQAYEHGATQVEIAEKLGVSRQRVGVIMSQALDKLAESILHF